jgi:hypothetical protein
MIAVRRFRPYSEASARSTLYVMALSSSLVAMGFVAGTTNLLVPFAAISLPAVFLLGIFTVVRLVETGPALAFFGTTASMIAVRTRVTRWLQPSRWMMAVRGIP